MKTSLHPGLSKCFWHAFIGLMCIWSPLDAQSYEIRNFNSITGMNQSYVYAIHQDYKGYLWMGTAQGLMRYNGYTFSTFTKNDSLADDFVTCIARDGKKMWLGHMNGDLSFYNGHTFTALHLERTDKSPVSHFAMSPDGMLWAGTNNGTLLKLGNDGTLIHIFRGAFESITAMAFMDNSTLLIGSNSGVSLCRFNVSEIIQPMQKVEGIPQTKVVDILPRRSGNGFYVATENDGVFNLRFTSQKTHISRIKGDSKNLIGLQSIYEDSRSNLWLASFGSGVMRIDHPDSTEISELTLFNKSTGFITDNIKSVFEDSDGNIWCGNYGNGISRLRTRNFTFVGMEEKNPGNILAMCKDKGFIWAGTNRGLFKLAAGSGLVVDFTPAKELRGNITALHSESSERLWIGTDLGVFVMDTRTKKIQRHAIGHGNLENSITCIIGYDGAIWIGTKKGMCRTTILGKNTWYTMSRGGLPHNSVNNLFADHAGRLWISTQCNTLSCIKNNQLTKILLNVDPRLMWISSVSETSDSSIWVATMGNGTMRIHNNNVKRIDSKEGLLSDYCHAVITDSQDRIWVTHKDGISMISATGNIFIKTFPNPVENQNRYIINPTTACRDDKDVLWFGTNQGLLKYETELYIQSNPLPVVDITSLTINGRTVPVNSRLILKPGSHKVTVGYIAVNLKEPDGVQYELMLEGFDRSFVKTKKRSISYNLQDGHYKLLIHAITGMGLRTTTPVELVVIIRKQIWRHWWFFPVSGLSIMLILVLLFQARERQLRYEKRILEAKVIERTREIELQKNEIETQGDLILLKNKEITSSIRYALKIQKAVLPTRCQINEIFPENMLFMKPKDIVSGDFYWLTEKKDKVVFTVADCTGHGVPGAFLSMLAMTMIKEIVNIQGLLSTDLIVNRLHTMVNHSLNKSHMEGLDLSLCIYDKKKKLLQYTGAMNHLVYIRDGKLDVLQADHYSVNSMREDFRAFSMKEIEVKKGDIFYLFSDGYMDQFGGANDKKFSARQFYALLTEIHLMPMEQQEIILEERLMDWMQDTEQTDDITVLGIQINN